MATSELKKMVKLFNKSDDVDEIDVDQSEKDLLDDFMTAIEHLDDSDKLGVVPKEVVKFYEKTAKAQLEAENDDAAGENDYDDMSTKELRKAAEELDVEDPDDMSRKELIAAIIEAKAKAAEEEETSGDDDDYDDMSTKELRKKAESLDVDDADDMGRKELIEAIQAASKDSGGEDDEDLDDLSTGELKDRAKDAGMKAKDLKKAKRKDLIKFIESAKDAGDTEEDEPDYDDMSTKELRALAKKKKVKDYDDMGRKDLVKAIKKVGKKKGGGVSRFSKPEGALSLSEAVAAGFKHFKGKSVNMSKIGDKANDLRVESGGKDNAKSALAYVKFMADTLVALKAAKKDGKKLKIN